jgi:hypothetical protein
MGVVDMLELACLDGMIACPPSAMRQRRVSWITRRTPSSCDIACVISNRKHAALLQH